VAVNPVVSCTLYDPILPVVACHRAARLFDKRRARDLHCDPGQYASRRVPDHTRNHASGLLSNSRAGREREPCQTDSHSDAHSHPHSSS
jgi:hypothetical protein